jgi:hypothetical protein
MRGWTQIASGIGFGRENTSNWGTYLSFKTHSPDTSNIDALDERFRIHANGDITVASGSIKLTEAGQGINFHPSSGTSNLLDEYEEGTWTPAFAGSTTTNFTYSSNQGGSYVRIGRMVWCHGRIELTNNSGSGNLSVTGLPFSCGDVQSGGSGYEGDLFTGFIDNAQSATSGPMGVVNQGETAVALYHAISSGNGSTWTAAEMDNSVTWSFSVIYPAA